MENPSQTETNNNEAGVQKRFVVEYSRQAAIIIIPTRHSRHGSFDPVKMRASSSETIVSSLSFMLQKESNGMPLSIVDSPPVGHVVPVFHPSADTNTTMVSSQVGRVSDGGDSGGGEDG